MGIEDTEGVEGPEIEEEELALGLHNQARAFLLDVIVDATVLSVVNLDVGLVSTCDGHIRNRSLDDQLGHIAS